MKPLSENLDRWGMPIPLTSNHSQSLVETEAPLKPLSDLKKLTPALAKAAQAVYDDWGSDEFGNVWCRFQEGPGGICHLIADEMISVITSHGFDDCTTLSHDSMVHVSVLVKTADGVAEVDIDPYRYETGGGYNWKKIPDVSFEPEDVSIHIINKDPEVFSQHLNEELLSEAEYKGRKVKLNKPFRTPDGPKKFSVYTKNENGNVVKVNFGDPNMEIKRDDPNRRKNFRARHNCDNPGPKWKPRYWSCQATWHPSKKVSDVVEAVNESVDSWGIPIETFQGFPATDIPADLFLADPSVEADAPSCPEPVTHTQTRLTQESVP